MERMTARDPAFAAGLRERVRGQVKESEPLARYSTYRIGGPATVLQPAGAEDVGAALAFAHQASVPWFAIGLGSNILLPDEGLDALVIRLGKGLDAVVREGDRWIIGAGLPAPHAARRTAEAGYGGLHIFVGVPGTVGGGVYMNAGCHGGDWAAVVQSVTMVDETGHDAVLSRAQVPFTYRWSGLERRIVLQVTVELREEDPARLGAELEEMYRWRREGTPFNQPCCGSVFKHTGGHSWRRTEGPQTAGQLIQAAGLKGFRIGAAEVSPVHANYFINTGGASSADVRGLIAHARRVVQEQFDVELQTEVKLIAPDGTYLEAVHE